MEDETTECSTGILVDIEDKLDEKLSVVSLHVEKPENNDLNGFNLNGRSNKNLLGGDLSNRRDVFGTPKGGWKTPSPKSMRKINREASRIINQLHSSPIETVEAQLIDEDFPTPFSLDGSTSESSPESESTCSKGVNKNISQVAFSTCLTNSYENESIQTKTESLNGVENESPIQNEIDSVKEVKSEPYIQNVKVLAIQDGKEVIQNESESTIQDGKEVIQNESESTIQKESKLPSPNETDSVNDIKNESHIQNENVLTIQDGKETIENKSGKSIQNQRERPSLKEAKTVKNEFEVPDDHTVSPNNMNSSTLELQSVNKNELKTPLSKKVLGKENISAKKDVSKLRFGNNSIGLMKKCLIEPKSFIKPISALNSNPPCNDSVRKDKANANPDKTGSSKKILPPTPSGINRRNSILPKLASTMPSLPGPLRSSGLSKTPKLMATPVPKLVRTQSFQSASGKYASRNPESVTNYISSKNLKSGIGSIKKDSNPVGNRRLSTFQIPSTGSPVCRSKSFPKSSGASSSRLSRPSLSASRPIGSAAKPSQISDPNRSTLSTSSRIRFVSRLDLPSPLPDHMSSNLSRKLFPDAKPFR